MPSNDRKTHCKWIDEKNEHFGHKNLSTSNFPTVEFPHWLHPANGPLHFHAHTCANVRAQIPYISHAFFVRTNHIRTRPSGTSMEIPWKTLSVCSVRRLVPHNLARRTRPTHYSAFFETAETCWRIVNQIHCGGSISAGANFRNWVGAVAQSGSDMSEFVLYCPRFGFAKKGKYFEG